MGRRRGKELVFEKRTIASEVRDSGDEKKRLRLSHQ